ncbi:MAG: hypothetical protein AAB801_02885 [Patescibacteria group bacterium]
MATNEQHIPGRSSAQEVVPPMPRERSLVGFFEDLGVTNLLVGTPGVGHERDWRVIPEGSPQEIDELIKTSASGRSRAFFRRTNESLSTRRVEHSAAIIPSSFGHTQEVSFTARDGTRYVFLSAGFNGSDFVLDLRIERPGEKPREADYTVLGLRIGRMRDEIEEVRKQREIELQAQIDYLLLPDRGMAGGILW